MESSSKMQNNNEKQENTKTIIYKGKEKIIPAHNPDETKCEYYIIKKSRYCNFEKFRGSEFCVYHRNESESQDEYLICPYDPKHRILKEKFKSHLKVCNTLFNKNEYQNSPWYIKNYNHAKADKNHILPSDEELKKIYSLKFEDIPIDTFEKYIDKILSVYEISKKIYEDYVIKNNLENYIKNILNVNIKNPDIFYTISGLDINKENDLKHTEKRKHLEKHSIQNEALGSVVFKTGLMDVNSENFYIVEFGAGKGGLSEEISKINENKSMYILLERAGLRFKKENKNRNEHTINHTIRYRTDIIDFNLNYIDNINEVIKEEKQKNNFIKNGYNILAIAKHICGCAFDLSLSCLFNYEHQERIKGIVMATCCHHICRVELLNNLYYYMDILKMDIKEIIFLFKTTSWLFSHEDENKKKEREEKKEKEEKEQKEENEIKKEKEEKKILIDKIFEKRNIDRKYVGIIAKYIVDIGRCKCLIDKGFQKVLYLKYCSNGITTENNMILAFRE